MAKKVEPEYRLLRDLKPNDIVALAKCDAYVVDVNATMQDTGTQVKEVVTVTYIPAHKVSDDNKKKDHRELTAFATDGVHLTVEMVPTKKSWFNWRQKETT